MIKAANTFKEELDKMRLVVNKLLSNRESIKVLEVGCGDHSFIKLKQNAYTVGIDISEKQLQRNYNLSEKILGDIQNYDLPKSEFDLVVCWWLLEHLQQPKRALENCCKSLKENGLIIIAVPNIYSVKGLLTKYTPHWFHIWVYRFIFGQQLAGTEDHPPCYTSLSSFISSESMKRFAYKNGFLVEYFGFHESVNQKESREKYRIVGSVWSVIKLTTKILTLGKISAENTDYIIVLKKQQTIKDRGNQLKRVQLVG
jgi:2-polyprenyl-3-methyl-5-hydroxy-6-metoxy-1,4-benzoquinol methylase